MAPPSVLMAGVLLALLGWMPLAGAVSPPEQPADTDTDTASAPDTAPEPPTAGTHVFTPGELRLYQYECRQTVTQRSLADEITFTTLLRWHFALQTLQTIDGRAELLATIYLVQAEHQGPGSTHRVDSSAETAAESEDPLLGHLLQLNGLSVELVWDVQAGELVAVTGSENVVDALAGSGIGAERRRSAAAAAYGATALQRVWEALLLQPDPGRTEPVAMAPPLQGQAVRSWQAGAWQLRQDGPMTATLATSPAPLEASITDLEGTGSVAIDEAGLLQLARGSLNYTCAWLALTQRASQQHQLDWQLVLLEHQAPE